MNKELAEHELALSQANSHLASRESPLINTRIIENFHVIKLPLLYQKLASDGILAYANVFGSDWYKNLYPTIKNQAPFLLFEQNFELMSLRDVFEKIAQNTIV